MPTPASYGAMEDRYGGVQTPQAGQNGSNTGLLRKATSKIIANRLASGGRRKPKWTSHARGREPGLDPHKASASVEGEIDAAAVSCDVVDLSKEHSEIKRGVDSKGLTHFIDHRPSWSKCRWINVNGSSWSVLRQLGLRYELHPLALEDALHTRNSRSKVDYYKGHVFCKILLHELDLSPPEEEKPKQSIRPPSPAGSLRSYLGGNETPTPDLETAPTRRQRTLGSIDDGGSVLGSTTNEQSVSSSMMGHRAAKKTVEEMTKQYRIRLAVQQLSIFLLRDGTLITLFEHDSSTVLAPIFARIRQDDTILRTSQDAGMLLQAILDLAVDELLEIIEAFRRQLTKLESRVLVQPEMDAVRNLHVLSGDLLLLKRTLTPIHALISTLRHHDTARGQIASGAQPTSYLHSPTARPEPSPLSLSSNDDAGFLSRQTKIYLADVLDHLDGVLSSLELFSGLANNLVEFSFQSIAFAQNESMRGLSVVTVIFLPLTFLSGYFGMNFTGFDEIEGPVSYFWKIAIPISVLCTLVFGYSYFWSIVRALGRRVVAYRHYRQHNSRRRQAAKMQ